MPLPARVKRDLLVSAGRSSDGGAMGFAAADWWVVAFYFAVTLVLGFAFAKRAGSGLSEYFLAGRRAPWWLAGTGMVATTFAADTPLWVAGQVAQHGIAGNWLWWSQAAGGMLTVFFFARMWRRAGVLTDVEFLNLRYDRRPLLPGFLRNRPSLSFLRETELKDGLRAFKAIYFGVILNCIIIAWVNLAMLKILRILLPGMPAELLLCVIAASVTLYVMLAGLWGVALADVFQFTVAMVGCIVLAVFAVESPALQAKGGLTGALPAGAYNFLPNFQTLLPTEGATAVGSIGAAGFHLSVLAFMAFAGVQWWSAWYPGAEPGGGGYIAQRIMSARSEEDGLLSVLWFVIANYCLRSWPWIVAGLAAAALYSHLPPNQAEDGFVFLMRDVLPTPMRGLLFAAFLGAYMSTLSTQLNWGGSYLVNDFYRPYVRHNETEAHYVGIARASAPLLVVPALLVTFFLLKTIHGAWAFLIEFGAGTGFVLILRWYWWRINATAELVSMVASAVLVLLLKWLLPLLFPNSGWLAQLGSFPSSLFVITFINIASTLAVVLLTAPSSRESRVAFYRKVRPAGPGWRSVALEAAAETGGPLLPPAGSIARSLCGWAAGLALVYTLMFAVGAVVLGRHLEAACLFGGALVSGAITFMVVRAEFRKN